MTQTSAAPGLFHFPALHPSLAVGDVPAAVRFFDPGLAPADDPRFWRPEALPMTETDLAGFLRDFARLRQEVKNPKDLRLMAEATGGYFFTDTTFAVREELSDHLHPERVTTRRLRTAQLTLCLAWMVEESLLDLAGSGEAEKRFRAAMAESLGLDDLADEDEAAALALAVAGESLPQAAGLAEEFGVPWQRLLAPLWALLPEGACLFTADQGIAAIWQDAGLALAAPDPGGACGLADDPDLAGRLWTVTETGWRLLGKTRPDPEAPWLDTPRTVVVLGPSPRGLAEGEDAG